MTVDTQAIAACTKLATLETRAWRPHRRHKAETQEERARHGTDAVSVRICLTDAKSLRAIVQHQELIQRRHRAMTYPSVSEGLRILPAGREFAHAEMLREAAVEHAALADVFVAEYPGIRASAPTRLGALYEPTLWPDDSTMAGYFGIHYRYLPCPADGQWSGWLAESAETAVACVRERVRGSLTNLADQLRHGKRLHGSLVRDVMAAIDDIAEGNLTSDPALTVLLEPMREISQHSIESLRDDTALRGTIAARAESIVSVFGSAL